MDDDAALQLATSHSDNAPASSLATTAGADPTVSGCTLTSTMENAANAYSAASCEIRGTGAGGSTDNDKGYYGTGQQWSATGYSAGAANKSQLRTAVLSNGKVIWDFAGNVWEWNDWLCGTGTWYSVAGWIDWTNANLTDYEKYAAGPSGSLTSANGAGQYYACSANGNAAVRGGAWGSAAVDGPFALNLGNAPSDVGSSIGFRCASIHAVFCARLRQGFGGQAGTESLFYGTTVSYNSKDLDDYRLDYRPHEIRYKIISRGNNKSDDGGERPKSASCRVKAWLRRGHLERSYSGKITCSTLEILESWLLIRWVFIISS